MSIRPHFAFLLALTGVVLTATVASGQNTCPDLEDNLTDFDPATSHSNGKACFTEQNYEEAIKWWNKIEEDRADFNSAAYNIGSVEYNIGLSHIQLNRRDSAAQYFAKAAAKGIHQAQYNLGILYWEENDALLSYAWIKVAADDADADNADKEYKEYKESLQALSLTEDEKEVAEAIAKRLTWKITVGETLQR